MSRVYEYRVTFTRINNGGKLTFKDLDDVKKAKSLADSILVDHLSGLTNPVFERRPKVQPWEEFKP